jgi:hypothetical protein
MQLSTAKCKSTPPGLLEQKPMPELDLTGSVGCRGYWCTDTVDQLACAVEDGLRLGRQVGVVQDN